MVACVGEGESQERLGDAFRQRVAPGVAGARPGGTAAKEPARTHWMWCGAAWYSTPRQGVFPRGECRKLLLRTALP